MKMMQLLTLSALLLAGNPVSAKRLGQFRRKNPAVVKPQRVTPRRLQTDKVLVSQTFFVPLPEEILFDTTFQALNGGNVAGDVVTLISVTISTDSTIVWYDHQEDGFDADVSMAPGSTTEVWGDGDSTNGCAPRKDGVACSDVTDVLMAGQVILLENNVPTPRDNTVFLYDGGDRVQASLSISITRAAYPESPGPLLAGGIEVLDTSSWGKVFEAPVGENTVTGDNDPFEQTQLYVMAGEDNTVMTTPEGTFTLAQGETRQIRVDEGDQVTSDKPVQVDLITGDVQSTYELRWYSLLTIESWSNTYVAPVGNDKGDVKVVVYNPNAASLTVTCQKRNPAGNLVDVIFDVPSKSSFFSDVIGDNSGAMFSASSNFFALAVIDSVGSGEIYDWGYPLVPMNQLTPEVIVGLGFGCEGNDCFDRNGFADEPRSVVYVTPTADATIQVDYDNDGVFDASFDVLRLVSIGIADPNDQDMSGGRIKATALGDPTTDVPIAAAWGQDPDRSRASDIGALDLGTVILPFQGFKAAKDATIRDENGNGLLGPGDIITYTIQVSNVGSGNVGVDKVTITDILDDHVTYITDSLVYIDGTDEQLFPGAAFPLAGPAGIKNPFPFVARGGTHQIVFDCLINTNIPKAFVFNEGQIRTGNILLEFEETTELEFDASIQIEKTVYEGQDGVAGCPGFEEAEVAVGAIVTFCFEVTNNGDTLLGSVDIDDAGITFNQVLATPLAPGETRTLATEKTVMGNQSSFVTATGIPIYANGDPILSLGPVDDTDDAGVVIGDPDAVCE